MAFDTLILRIITKEIIMGLNVYLNFKGNCKEAAETYAKAFKSQEPKILLFGDVPAQEGQPPLSEEDKKLVMHTEVHFDGTIMMMSDVPSFMPFVQGNNISLVLNLTQKEQIDAIFEELKVGGTVIMEPSETFFSKYYAYLTDRFGISWQLSMRPEQS
jgi:PhnB protein